MGQSRTPEVAVVVPCYNAERTLRLCLDSVLLQTYRPTEVVVVDDASTDRSAAIAAELGCRVVALSTNKGVSAARNAGIAATRSEVILFLDADVALAPDALANAIRVLTSDPKCGCVHGIYDTKPLIDDGPVERYRILHAVHWRRRYVGQVQTVVFALAAVRRKALVDAGPLDEGLRDSEDVEYSARLALRWRIELTDTMVGRHDDADRVSELLAEQFRRARPLVELALRSRGAARLERANAPLGVVAIALAAMTWPLTLLHPALMGAPAALVALFVLSDLGLLGFVRREGGWRFLIYFLLLHLLSHLALVGGLIVGAGTCAADYIRGAPRRLRAAGSQ